MGLRGIVMDIVRNMEMNKRSTALEPVDQSINTFRIPELKLILIFLLLVIVAVTMLLPFAWTVITSLKTAEEAMDAFSFIMSWNFQNYIDIFGKYNFGRYYANTIIVTIASLSISIVISLMSGYAFSRLDFWGREILFWIYLATMMIPRQVRLIPTFILFKNLGLVDNLQAIIYPWMFDIYGIFLMRQFLQGVPKSLEEAAIIDGAGYFRRFTQITIPLVKPAITSLFIIQLVKIWNSYIFPLVMLHSEKNRTLTLGLGLLRGDLDIQWEIVMAATVITILPLIILFLFAQQFFIKGIAITGSKE